MVTRGLKEEKRPCVFDHKGVNVEGLLVTRECVSRKVMPFIQMSGILLLKKPPDGSTKKP
jgi:hypothetical protein